MRQTSTTAAADSDTLPGQRSRRCARSLLARTRCKRAPACNHAPTAPGLLAVIAAVVVSGCGPGLPEGPLSDKPENPTLVSQPMLRGGADTIGFDAVFNVGSAPAVIDRVVVRSPRHIKFIGAYVTVGGLIGNWAAFPPEIMPKDGEFKIWVKRQKPAGAIIPPHSWAGIALGLAATSTKGSIDGINVFYHVGPARYEWHSHIRIVLTSVTHIPGIPR